MHSVDAAMSFSSVKIEEIYIVVNADLACLEKWFESDTLSFNIVKTHAMILGSVQKLGQMNKTPDITPCFHINGNETDFVDEKVEKEQRSKAPSQENATCPWASEVCQTMCSRRQL